MVVISAWRHRSKNGNLLNVHGKSSPCRGTFPANISVVCRRYRRHLADAHQRRSIGNPRRNDRSPGFFARRQTVNWRQNRQRSPKGADMIPLRRSSVINSTYMLQRFRTLTQRCGPNIAPPLACHHKTSFPSSVTIVRMSACCRTLLFIIVKNTSIDFGLTTS